MGGGCVCVGGGALEEGGVVYLVPPPLLTMILRGFVGFNLFKLAKNL